MTGSAEAGFDIDNLQTQIRDYLIDIRAETSEIKCSNGDK